MHRSVIVCLLLLCIAGCATRRKYVEPASSDTATLVFLNSTGHPAYAMFYEDATRCSRISYLDDFTEREKPLRVEAGEDLAVSFGVTVLQTSRTVRSCTLTMSFLPVAGETYSFNIFWNYDTRKCSGILQNRLTGAAPARLKQRTWVRGWDYDSDFCEPAQR